MSHEFDGASGEITYGSAAVLDDLAVGAAFSMHVWYNADTVGEGNVGRIADKRPGSGNGGWVFGSDAVASLRFASITGAGAVGANQRGADNACSLGAWHSVVVTYDDSGDRKGHIYVDGAEIGYDTDTAASVANGADADGDFLVGNNGAGSNTFDGELAEFATWDRVITAAEITQLAAGFSPLFFGASIILYAPLVRSENDLKGNGATATNTTVTPHPTPIYNPAPSLLSRPSHTTQVLGDHDSEDPVRGDFGGGIPGHTAPQGSFYYSMANRVLYVREGSAWRAQPVPDESARAYHDAAQSINHATSTTVAFNQDRWDTNDLHDPVTNNSRLTAKVAGKYIITAHLRWESNATGFRQVELRINGVTAISNNRYPAIATSSSILSVGTVWDMAVDDYVEVRVYQDSTVALNIEASQASTPEFTMTLIR